MSRRVTPEQRAAFKAELARLLGREHAGTLTPAEHEALRRATVGRNGKIAAAEVDKAAEASRIAKAIRNGRPHPELPSIPEASCHTISGSPAAHHPSCRRRSPGQARRA